MPRQILRVEELFRPFSIFKTFFYTSLTCCSRGCWLQQPRGALKQLLSHDLPTPRLPAAPHDSRAATRVPPHVRPPRLPPSLPRAATGVEVENTAGCGAF